MKQKKKTDCGFTNGDNWFRYRVGAIIIEDGCVLVAGNDKENYYYSVGGVHMNEKAEDAVLREVMEETGVAYQIDRLASFMRIFGTATARMIKGCIVTKSLCII